MISTSSSMRSRPRSQMPPRANKKPAAPSKIDPLIGGLEKMQVAVAKFRGELPSARDIERLQASSPGLFSSGYFVLAAVAGSPGAGGAS